MCTKQILFLFLQVLLIGAFTCFIIAEIHGSHVAVTALEICIILFFILIYMLTLHHLLIYLHWPSLVSVHFHSSNTSFALSPGVEAFVKWKHQSYLSRQDRAELWQLGCCPGPRRETSLIPRKIPWTPLSIGQPSHTPASISLWAWTHGTFQVVLKKCLIHIFSR